MDLLDCYRFICKQDDIARKYYQCGENDYGNPLKIFNTNYRTLFGINRNQYTGFAVGFEAIESEEGKERSEFQHSERTGQEVNKQHTVRMRNSWLFQEKDGIYHKTKRGLVFGEMLDDSTLTVEEKKLLCFLLILPGYFYDIPNFLCQRTEKLFKYCEKAGYNVSEILELQREFFLLAVHSTKNELKEKLRQHDYFYVINFIEPYNADLNFLKQYHDATKEERQELKDYVCTCDIEKDNLLLHKYKSGGNFTYNTLLETTWIMYICKVLKDTEMHDFEDFINTLLRTYQTFYTIEKKRVRKFINDRYAIFDVIYKEVYDIKDIAQSTDTQTVLTQEEVDKIGIIDSTDNEGREKLEKVSNYYKCRARIESHYHCVLENIEGCKYFTSKETNENFLEVHHLIPHAVANRFDSNIEVLENYVPLCPNCHRKIHKAVDRERMSILRYIYNLRKDSLMKKGIEIEKEDELFSFYGITDR